MSFDYEAHKKLWGWLELHPMSLKEDWPEWEVNGGTYPAALNDCFACNTNEICEECPLEWPTGGCYDKVVNGERILGLFGKWNKLTKIALSKVRVNRMDLAMEYVPEIVAVAREIKNLPLAQPAKKPQLSYDEDNDEDDDLYDRDDAVYDRRIDDALCGDDDWIIPYPIDEEF